MRRVPQLVAFIIVFVVMAGVGYGVRAWWGDPVPEPAGWCCATAGSTCVQSANLTSCRAQGGSVFDISQSVCNTVCASLR